MALSEEQRKKFEALKNSRYEQRRTQEISRLKSEMTSEIADFSERYEFADDKTREKLDALISRLPSHIPARIDFDKTSFYKGIQEESIDRNTKIWICFLVGCSELFEISVLTTFGNFLDDYDVWYYYSPYLLLIYDDLENFIYIDDNGNITQSSFKGLK